MNSLSVRCSFVQEGPSERLCTCLQGCEKITLLNRSAERAEALAADFPEVEFSINLMPDLMQRVAESDVVFVASGSESTLIHGPDLAEMPRASHSVGGVRRFFDISVPRNVASDVCDVDGAQVFNVDDLKEVSSTPLFSTSFFPLSCSWQEAFWSKSATLLCPIVRKKLSCSQCVVQ